MGRWRLLRKVKGASKVEVVVEGGIRLVGAVVEGGIRLVEVVVEGGIRLVGAVASGDPLPPTYLPGISHLIGWQLRLCVWVWV